MASDQIRVVHLSTYDVLGGAGRAACRLHDGLRLAGASSRMIVAWKHGTDDSVLEIGPATGLTRWRRAARRRLIALPMRCYQRTRPVDCELFSTDRSAFGRELAGLVGECDIIHLHWVSELVDVGQFLPAAARLAPIVWTLHDMNPFTGGCHYSGGCGRFTGECGACPQLGSDRENDLSRRIWQRKAAAMSQVPADRLAVVAPSKWMTDLAGESSLMGRFERTIIPNGVDTDVFTPADKSAARRELQLPAGARIVLMIAHDLTNRRKGAGALMEALACIADQPDLLLMTVGLAEVTPPAGVAHRHVGQVAGEAEMARLYNAADVLAIPSAEDNLPNTMLEAMSCGLPVAGLAAGGVGEWIRPGSTGLLAEPGNAAHLGRNIAELLGDAVARRDMGANCRQISQREFSLAATAGAHLQLYRQLLARAGGTGAPPADVTG